MEHILKLPNEVLLGILKELPRPDLFTVCVVSRFWNNLATYIIYERINLQVDQLIPFLSIVLHDSRLANYARSCRIAWFPSRVRPGQPSLWAQAYKLRNPTPVTTIKGAFDAVGRQLTNIGTSTTPSFGTTDKARIISHAKQLGCSPKMLNAVEEGDSTALVLLTLMTLNNLKWLQVEVFGLGVSLQSYLAELLHSGRFLRELVRLECQEWDPGKTSWDSRTRTGSLPLFSSVLATNTARFGQPEGLNSTAAAMVDSYISIVEETTKTGCLSEVVIDTDKSDPNSLTELIYGPYELNKISLRISSSSIFKDHNKFDLLGILHRRSSTLRQLIISLCIQNPFDQHHDRFLLRNLSNFNALEVLAVPLEVLLGINPKNPRTLHLILPRSLKKLHLGSQIVHPPTIPSWQVAQAPPFASWQDSQVLDAITRDLPDLSVKCPHLKVIELDISPYKEDRRLEELRESLGIRIIYNLSSSLNDVFRFTFPVEPRVIRRK